jgi:hypothetical protein
VFNVWIVSLISTEHFKISTSSRIIVSFVLLKLSQLGITPEAFSPCELEYRIDEQVMTFGKVARLVDLRIEKERRIGLSE